MAAPCEDESISECSEDDVITSTESNDSSSTGSSSSDSSSPKRKRKKRSVYFRKFSRRKGKKFKQKQKRKRRSSSESSGSSHKAFQPKAKKQKRCYHSKRKSQGKHDKQKGPKAYKKQVTFIFQKYYGKLLRLLKTCSTEVPAEMYSKQLITSELITAEKDKILESLKNHVHSDPKRIFDVIECLEEELSCNSVLKDMKGNYHN